jgi:hypothetical protein
MVNAARVVPLLVVAACAGSPKGPPAPALIGPACEPELYDAKAGNHDRVVFAAGELYGYKNGAGEVVIHPRFAMANEFNSGGVAGAVEDGTMRLVFIDTAGAVLAEAYPMDNGPDYFQEGLARIAADGTKVGFIDRTGAIVIPPQFAGATPFCNGRASVSDHPQVSWHIDHTGRAVDEKYDSTGFDDSPRGEGVLW